MICEMKAFIKAGRFRDASPCAISFSGKALRLQREHEQGSP